MPHPLHRSAPTSLDKRATAELIITLAEDIARATAAFDRLWNRMDPASVTRLDAVPFGGQLDGIVSAYAALGEALFAECDAADDMQEAA